MVIWLCLRWWYSAGWRWVWKRSVSDRLEWYMQAFSMSVLASTLFAPFRQTYAGKLKGTIGDRVRGLVDRFISRTIGFLVRITILTVGVFASIFAIISGLVALALWPFIPMLPIISLILAISGFKL